MHDNLGIDQICYYFEEGRRQWARQPELVLSRKFYEMWELTVRPRPFRIVGEVIELFDFSFPLVTVNGERIGRFRWLDDESCACLEIESAECIERFLLCFDDGEPLIYETEPYFFSPLELSHGERLEVVYEVVTRALQYHPEIDILKMTKREFLTVLDDIAPFYPALTVRAMRSLDAFTIKSLLKKATADIPADELTPQLTLPLDGTHIDGTAPPDIEQRYATGRKPCTFRLPSQTLWTVICAVEFLNNSCHRLAEFEKDYYIPLENFEPITSLPSGDMAVRISFDSQVLLREGDILRLSPAERRDEKLGTFRVELCDGDTLYGTVRSDCSAAELRRCVILPRRSPNSFVAKSFNRLVEFLKVKSTQLSEPLRASLGLEETTIRQAIAPQAPEIFDASQQMAWSSAVDDDNRVVLIQGPPGTGKTRVIAAIVEELSRQNKRVLVSAPSHTAVDNICRRLRDVPVLRIGINVDRIAPDIAADYWEGELDNIRKFAARIRNGGQGGVWAGTPIGLLRSNIFWEEIKSNGQFDVVILDEAGMARVVDYLLLSEKSRRAILVGDHQQLPPFPLPQEVADELQRDYQAIPGYYWGMVKQSALEWMVEERGFPLLMLKFSYRCQNPRLLRFCSILFYDAAVKINPQADYYRLGYHERHSTFPPSTLRLYSTSALPERLRQEKVCFEGGRPGIENLLEAKLAVRIFYQTLSRYDSREVTIIAPYRRQVQLIRRLLSYDNAARYLDVLPEREEWEKMLLTQIATVDSFQGNESDVVITCYVRSNRRQGIGFVDDGNRINVAHTRCRREMVVIGDIEGLKQQERGNIFKRMERAIARDGEIIVLSEAQAEAVMNDDEVDLATAETITPAEEIAPPAPVPLSADTATEERPGDGSDREAKVQPTLFHL